MKTYEVNLTLRARYSEEVEAESKEEAIRIAESNARCSSLDFEVSDCESEEIED